MCEFKAIPTPAKGGGIDVTCTCEISGKPITITNEHGMFCADMCQLQECKDAGKVLEDIFNVDTSKSDDEQAEELLGNLFAQMGKLPK